MTAWFNIPHYTHVGLGDRDGVEIQYPGYARQAKSRRKSLKFPVVTKAIEVHTALLFEHDRFVFTLPLDHSVHAETGATLNINITRARR